MAVDYRTAEVKQAVQRRGPAALWGAAIVTGVLIWAALLYYHFLRRGVWNPFGAHELAVFDLSNKCFALAAVVLVSLGIAIGPLARLRLWRSGRVPVRRELGLVAVGFMVVHVQASLLLMTPEELVEQLLPVTVGLLSLVVFGYITAHSTAGALQRDGARRWKAIQRLVYPALALAVAHYLLYGKIGGWMRWFETIQPPLPGSSLVVTAVVATALALRGLALCLDANRAPV